MFSEIPLEEILEISFREGSSISESCGNSNRSLGGVEFKGITKIVGSAVDLDRGLIEFELRMRKRKIIITSSVGSIRSETPARSIMYSN